MSDRPARAGVLFRVAAGPRVGFGHLVRALSLAEALGVTPAVSLRGGAASRAAAARLGAVLVPVGPAGKVLAAASPRLLVVDDRVARQTASWRRAARRLGIPVASVHDLGLGLGDADLIVDASLWHPSLPKVQALLGPAYAILRPSLGRARAGSLPGRTRPTRVLIALGGGPRAVAAARLARRISDQHRSVRVAVAAGFAARPTTGHRRRVHQVPPRRFDAVLARADVVVTGGGVTLYEACAAGVPSVAVAVAASQLKTIETIAALGATLDGGPLPRGSSLGDGKILQAVSRLLSDGPLRRELRSRGRRLVDGRGAARVARALRRLMRAGRGGGR